MFPQVAHGRDGARNIHGLGQKDGRYKRRSLVEELINDTREQITQSELPSRADRSPARNSLYDHYAEARLVRGSDSALLQNAIFLREHIQSEFVYTMVSKYLARRFNMTQISRFV